MNKKNSVWWLRCVLHNCIVHPMLPLAELADSIGWKSFANLIFDLHDKTVPGDK